MTRLPALRAMRCVVVLADCRQDTRWRTRPMPSGCAGGGAVGGAGRRPGGGHLQDHDGGRGQGGRRLAHHGVLRAQQPRRRSDPTADPRARPAGGCRARLPPARRGTGPGLAPILPHRPGLRDRHQSLRRRHDPRDPGHCPGRRLHAVHRADLDRGHRGGRGLRDAAEVPGRGDHLRHRLELPGSHAGAGPRDPHRPGPLHRPGLRPSLRAPRRGADGTPGRAGALGGPSPRHRHHRARSQRR